MLLLNHSFQTPQENLAFEAEYFQSFSEETLRIWRNPKSVIIGKHQNAYSESNILFCLENNIPILRRISGGGTVFHDLGNINFSFFRFVDSTNQIRYDENLSIISAVLKKLGYEVDVNERHDIFSKNFKISGNAQHVSRGRALHHGTILYDSKLNQLSRAIKKQHGRFTDKSVKSKRSPVTNLRKFIDLGDVKQFESSLIAALSAQLDTAENPIISLKQSLDKLHLDDWNFDYGPKFTFNYDDEGKSIQISVDRGGSLLDWSTNVTPWSRLFKKLPKGAKFGEIRELLDLEYTAESAKLREILYS